MTNDAGSLILGAIVLVFAVGAYFFPWIIAAARKHPNLNSIVILNLLLGWTVIGWVIALIWAASHVGAQPVRTENSAKLRACPFCAEKIQALAIKCRHCGSVVEAQP